MAGYYDSGFNARFPRDTDLLAALALTSRRGVGMDCRKMAGDYSVERAASGIAAAYRAVTGGTDKPRPAA